MNSTFSRAIVGFIALTSGLIFMAYIALWAVSSYAAGLWWMTLLIILLALVLEFAIYLTTLAEPVTDWIGEPKRKAKAEAEAKSAAAWKERHDRADDDA